MMPEQSQIVYDESLYSSEFQFVNSIKPTDSQFGSINYPLGEIIHESNSRDKLLKNINKNFEFIQFVNKMQQSVFNGDVDISKDG